MAIRFSNNAQTTLASGITAAATSISVVDGSVFPALTPGDHTYVTLEDTSGNLEIVKVTAISSNTLTVTRGQDGTTAQAFSSGDFVQLRVTAALLNDLADEASVTLWADVQNKPDPVITLAGDASGSVTLADLASATLTVTVSDDSHNHVISNVDGLQSALNAKQDASTALTTSSTFGGDVSGTYNAIVVANDSHTHDGRYYTESEIDTRIDNNTLYATDALTSADDLDSVTDNGFYRWTSSAPTNNPSGTYHNMIVQTDGGQPTQLVWGGSGNSSADLHIRRRDNGTWTSWTEFVNSSTQFGGDVSGTYNAIVVADDSHNHIISNVDGLQTALDGKTAPPTSNDTFSGTYSLVWVANDGLYSSTFMTINGSTDTLSVPNVSTGAITSTGTSTFAGIRLNNSNTSISQGSGNALRIQTNSGYVDVGPKNTSWAHFDTDRGKFYFGQDVHVNGQLYFYNAGTNNTPYWHAGNDGASSGLDADLLDGYHETSFVRTSTGVSSNLDSDYRAGMTGYSPSTSGTKPDTGYGQIINIVSSGSSHNNSNNWITQLAFGTGQDSSWFRSKTNSGAWGAWRTIWNDSNDGSGSGLDADLLDGIDSSQFLRSDAADTAAGKITFSTGIARSNHNVGHLEGSYNNVGNNSSNTNPIYTIGSSYNPTATALSNMYGIGFARRDATGYLGSFTGSGWGMYVASDGDARIWLDSTNGEVSSTGQHYAAGSVVWNAGNDGSGSGLDADLLDGMNASSSVVANTIVARQANGYIYANHINFSTSETENPTINSFFTSNGDGWSRKSSKSHVISQLSSGLVTHQAGSRQSIDFNSSSYIKQGFYNAANNNSNKPSGASDYGQLIVAEGIDTGLQIYGGYANTALYWRGWATSGGTLYNWHKLWSDQNDGSGSGLDADTVDGIHASSFTKTTDDLRDHQYMHLNHSNSGTDPENTDEAWFLSNHSNSPNSSYYWHIQQWFWNSKTTSSNRAQLAIQYNGGNDVYSRSRYSSWGSWAKLWSTANDGAGSGLDADLLDGLQATSLLRSDAADLFSGSYLEFQDNCVLRFGNGADYRIWHDAGAHTYFRNYAANTNTYFQGDDSAGTNHAFIYLRGDTTAPYVQLFGDGVETLRVRAGGASVYGDLNSPVINIDRANNTASGINWYSGSYKAWATYMAPTGAGHGPWGNITAPSGTLVTSWALRNFIENGSGYGWTFESGTSGGNPSVVAEIRSSDGAARFGGSVTSGGTVTAGTMRVTSGDGEGYGFWNSALGGAYRIYMSQATNGTYGGRVTGETTSDYNMYFKMQSGTNRGFVFRDDANNYASINPNGIYSEVPYRNPDFYRPYITGEGASGSDDALLTRWRYANTDTYYLDLNQRVTSSQLRWAFSVKNGSSIWADRLVFKNENVGIGGYQDPAYTLDVNGPIRTPTLYVGDGTDGYFYSDSAGRTAFRSGDFYIMNTVATYYNYATTQYYGAGSGDSMLFRGNTLSGNDWSISAGGDFVATRVSCGYDPALDGSISCSNWFRSSGNSGWYNGTYGGGMWMQDTTWVRTYGSKKFYVGGGSSEIATTGNVTAYYSDERLKDKTGVIENALEKVASLEGFFYVENDLARELGYTNTKEQVGLSAQRVQAVLPQAVSLAPVDYKTLEDGEIVSKSGENYLTVDYSRLVPLLVESIKELKAEVDDLKAQLKEK